MRLVTRDEMVRIDEQTVDHFGIAATTLMEAAGTQLAEIMVRDFGDQCRKALFICGKGNNGGDGLIAARVLQEQFQCEPRVILLAAAEELRDETKRALEEWQKCSGTLCILDRTTPFKKLETEIKRYATQTSLIVDGIFGTGLKPSRSIASENIFFQAIGVVNQIRQKKGAKQRVIAIDLPSGLDANSGLPVTGDPKQVITADLTVTMGLPKLGMMGDPGFQYCGKIRLARLPFPKELLHVSAPPQEWIDRRALRAVLKPRPRTGHKGLFGHTIIIGGSQRMPGALLMAVKGALRAGTGKITAIVPGKELMLALAPQQPEAMWLPVSADAQGFFAEKAAAEILTWLENSPHGSLSLVVGPGMGTGKGAEKIVDQLLALADEMDLPLVLDADALNILAKDPLSKLPRWSGLEQRAPIVLTPHPGELGKLLQTTAGQVQKDRFNAIQKAADKLGTWIILKGFRTLLASPPSRRKHLPLGRTLDVNSTGNAGMAKGGMGDVLSGILGARLSRIAPKSAESAEPWRKALQVGLFVHGLAGDMAKKKVGEESLLPADLLRALPRAFLKAAGRKFSRPDFSRLRLHVNSEAEMARWAQQLARRLKGGFVIGLDGGLGSGKTTFVRELVSGLEMAQKKKSSKNISAVHSPTFSLVHEYPTPIPVVHIDLYRLEGSTPQQIEGALDQLGFRDYLQQKNIVMIEWFSRLGPTPLQPQLLLHFAFSEKANQPEARWIEVSGQGSLLRELFSKEKNPMGIDESREKPTLKS